MARSTRWVTAMVVSPRCSTIRQVRSRIFRSDPGSREAVQLYRRAIEAAPRRPEFRLNLGALLEAVGDREGAADQYRAVLAYEPENEAARERLGR